MTNKSRSYSRESSLETPRRRHERALRNKARRLMLQHLTAKYGLARAKAMMAGKDVNHKKSLDNKGSTTLSNLELESPHANRARKEKDFNLGRKRKGHEPKEIHKVKHRS